MMMIWGIGKPDLIKRLKTYNREHCLNACAIRWVGACPEASKAAALEIRSGQGRSDKGPPQVWGVTLLQLDTQLKWLFNIAASQENAHYGDSGTAL